jgi:glycosyltransferase involved in cell wall biosynthesis
MGWGSNKDAAVQLMSRMGMESANFFDKPPRFPAGSMFWFRPAALRPILDLDLTYDNFPAEPIRDDGTLAHALERCLCEVVRREGYLTRDIEPLPYEACLPSLVTPKISVIIPVLNGERWIESAIRSILTQDATFATYEVLIVDNGSTDGTWEKLLGLYGTHPMIRILRQSQRGAGAARNLGIQTARGKFILFLDSDDVLTSNALGLMISLMDQIADLDFVTSSLRMFSETGFGRAMPFGSDGWYRVIDSSEFPSNENIWRMIAADFGPCAKLYRRNFLIKNDISFPMSGNFEDNAFIMGVYSRCRRAGVISAPTYLYRKFSTEDGRTQSTKGNIQAFSEQISAIKEAVTKYKISKSIPLHLILIESMRHKIRSEVKEVPREYAGRAAEMVKSIDDFLS